MLPAGRASVGGTEKRSKVSFRAITPGLGACPLGCFREQKKCGWAAGQQATATQKSPHTNRLVIWMCGIHRGCDQTVDIVGPITQVCGTNPVPRRMKMGSRVTDVVRRLDLQVLYCMMQLWTCRSGGYGTGWAPPCGQRWRLVLGHNHRRDGNVSVRTGP